MHYKMNKSHKPKEALGRGAGGSPARRLDSASTLLPGPALELPPLGLLQVPLHQAGPPWTQSWDPLEQGSGPAQLVTASPRRFAVPPALPTWPLALPLSLLWHPKALAKEFGSSGLDFGAP